MELRIQRRTLLCLGRHAGIRYHLHPQRQARAEHAEPTGRHAEGATHYEILPELKAVPEVLEHIEARHGQIPLAVVSAVRAIQ
jgi:hypothetical protein